MDDKLKERIAFELENRFYYIGYPANVPEFLWKDGEGKYRNMHTMGLDHLKASIRRIQKDRKAFWEMLELYKGDPIGPELVKALLPLVDEKLKQLQEVFKEKVEED